MVNHLGVVHYIHITILVWYLDVSEPSITIFEGLCIHIHFFCRFGFHQLTHTLSSHPHCPTAQHDMLNGHHPMSYPVSWRHGMWNPHRRLQFFQNCVPWLMCWGLLALLQFYCPVYCSTSAHFFHDRFYLDEIPVNRHSSSFVSRPLTSRRGNRRDQIGTNIGGCHLLQHLRRKKKGELERETREDRGFILRSLIWNHQNWSKLAYLRAIFILFWSIFSVSSKVYHMTSEIQVTSHPSAVPSGTSPAPCKSQARTQASMRLLKTTTLHLEAMDIFHQYYIYNITYII